MNAVKPLISVLAVNVGSTSLKFKLLVFGGVFSGIGAILPDFLWPWGNLAIYPFGIWILLLVVFAKFGGKKSG